MPARSMNTRGRLFATDMLSLVIATGTGPVPRSTWWNGFFSKEMQSGGTGGLSRGASQSEGSMLPTWL